jgi:hypothetical protein
MLLVSDFEIKKGSRTNVVYPSRNLGVYDASMFGRGSIWEL